ncbi:N-hydroxyarylamine O-acetyltransferase [Novosphingobium sp. PhB57]|uniref:arylamine N-acetyltransferase family protein n=1 Tax=Novosphingobium sp. PhB57 TaxID=2485107 RepID=UPI00104B3711|nr:arylamine N-acetyltransferase [Novosphingobium sp. PhB57]TCU61065.1 N-hydroxyarylamine O-acetyltransferase [Novosphingobium sp. PhB57]
MDIDRYFARIGLSEMPARSSEGLGAVQTAHRQSIGFENLAIPLGQGIRIDSASVFEKLVTRGRGGYCFEQNRLYADALSAMGLVNRPLLARVLLGLGEGVVPPRTHTLLLVNLDGEAWIADAGFGGSYVPPLPLEDGAQVQTGDGAWHRLLRGGERGSLGGEWRLERAGPAGATDGRGAPHGDWQPQYVFDLDDVAQDDLEMSNHWTSTRPGTRFTTLCVASVVLEGGFASLSDRQFTIGRHGESEVRQIETAAEYARLLGETFGITLSEEDAAKLPIFA